MLEKALERQTSAGILLPCITEILQYMDSSKHPDATRPSAILETDQKGYRRALHRVLLITKFPIGRKLLAGPSFNDDQEFGIISGDVHELKSKDTVISVDVNELQSGDTISQRPSTWRRCGFWSF